MRIRYARPLRRSQQLRCPLCLFAFRGSDALVRCERGCTAKDTTGGDAPLIFHPSESPKRGGGFIRSITSAQCPRCQRPSACWVCPACRVDLPSDGLGDPVLPFVILGGRSAGKTTLVTTLIQAIEEKIGPERGAVLDPWDQHTRDAYARARGDVEARIAIPHTDPTPTIRPWVFRLSESEKRAHRSQWVSVFDMPGAAWEDRAEEFLNSANFVTSSQALVLVLDATRFGPISTALQKSRGPRGLDVPGLKGDPYAGRRVSAVDEIRHLATFFGRRGLPLPSPTRLAIVLTKFDLWGELTPPHTLLRRLADGPAPEGLSDHDIERTVHNEVEALLCEWNGETFAQQVDQKFPEVRNFVVSSLGEAAGAPPGRLVKPFAWGIPRVAAWVLQ